VIERNTGRALGVAAALTVALAGCGDNAFGPEPTGVEFAASLGIDLSAMTETASGLYIRDDDAGTGEISAEFGDQATVTYTGWLVDGEQFDSGELVALLGVTNLIAGFTEGILGMRIGGTRTIVIPADLAYGSQESGGGIPATAVLVFELMLTSLVATPG
jgi:FKBP-type peptidyl-prolyl cis-trans isomerase FkpA